MSTPTYAELFKLALDRAGLGDPSQTDQPVTDALFARTINDACRDVWEVSGGRTKIVASATAWTNAQLCTGTVQGILTDIEEITHLYATTTAPASIVCVTATNTALTSAALFGPVTGGMDFSGSGITAGTRVASLTSTSALTLTLPATNSTSASRTFSPTTGTDMDEVDLGYIRKLRSASGAPTYIVPKLYSLTRLDAFSGASPNLVQLDYWPATTGYYFPAEYVAQWAAIDATTTTTPALNDGEATDAGLIAASRLCQMFDRNERVPGILADISTRTQALLERKLKAIMEGKADDAHAR